MHPYYIASNCICICITCEHCDPESRLFFWWSPSENEHASLFRSDKLNEGVMVREKFHADPPAGRTLKRPLSRVCRELLETRTRVRMVLRTFVSLTATITYVLYNPFWSKYITEHYGWHSVVVILLRHGSAVRADNHYYENGWGPFSYHWTDPGESLSNT